MYDGLKNIVNEMKKGGTRMLLYILKSLLLPFTDYLKTLRIAIIVIMHIKLNLIYDLKQ